MLKTKLESLLESGFSELDGFFGNREYGETIRLGATVDDAVCPVSVKDIKERFAKAASEEARFIASYSKYDLSDYQNPVFSDTVPFFRRIGFYKGFKVAYNAYTHPERDAYEPIADELVPQVDLETLEILWRGSSVIDLVLEKTVQVQHYVNDDNLAQYPDDIRERISLLLRLDSHQCEPEQVNEALMSFLR